MSVVTKIKSMISSKMPTPIVETLMALFGLYKNIRMPERKSCFGQNNPDNIFFVIRLYPPATGYLANYIYILGYVRYALGKNYIPVIDMENYLTLYTEKDTGVENVWEYIFQQPTQFSLKDVYASKNVVLSNGSMSLYDPSLSQETIDWQVKIAAQIKFQDRVAQHLKNEYECLLRGKGKVLGLPIRGTDYKAMRPKGHPIQADVEYLTAIIDDRKKKWDIDSLFIATEEEETINILKVKYPELIYTKRERYENYSGSNLITDTQCRGNTKYQTVLAYITEIYLLSQCSALIGTKNNGLITSILWNKLYSEKQFEHLELIDLGVYT